ncbi:MAG: 4a-hydroxytetrahydrobiopterin dehydratase [Planctomycetes bacterium]|nr:4a-hydroxytetrahydrobiopterin dehydratase [Planctomycetota bacterium]
MSEARIEDACIVGGTVEAQSATRPVNGPAAIGTLPPVPKPQPLDEATIARELASLRAWTRVDGRLRREFAFPDFSAAFAFMTRVAFVAERANHHPDWSNSWSKVVIELTSHDAGGLTQRDFDLARAIDVLASR